MKSGLHVLSTALSMRSVGLVSLLGSVLVLSGCGQSEPVDMSFEQAHGQFNTQILGDVQGLSQVLTREGMEGSENLLLDLQSNDFSASLDFSSDFVSEGVDMDASAMLDVAASFTQMDELIDLTANLDFDFRLIDGSMFFLVNNSAVEMSQVNPVVGMAQGLIDQLQGQWIEVDLNELATMAGDPSLANGSPFSPQAIEASEEFVLDMSTVLAENYLFAPLGDVYQKDGTTAYDLQINTEGVQTIVRALYEHPYIVSTMEADPSFSSGDIEQMIASIPASLEAVELDAHLLVHAEDEVELVIDSLRFAQEPGVLTAMVAPRKVQVRVYEDEAQENLLLTMDDTSQGVQVELYNQQEVFLSAILGLDSTVSENKVAYNLVVDGSMQLSVLDPFAPQDSSVDFSLLWDEESVRSSGNEIVVPEESQSIMDVFGGLMGPGLMTPQGAMTDQSGELEMIE